jgi:hypothetical protein
MTDYRTLALALHHLDADQRDAVAGADQRYTSALAAAEGEITNEDAVVRQAEAAAQLARQRVAEVDDRSAKLWHELATLLGRRGRRMGPVPAPSASPPRGQDAGWLDGTVAEPLDIAAETITRWALGEPIAPVPRWTVAALPPSGAIAALAVSLPIRGLLALTGERVFLLTLIAEILLFFAPFAGVPVLMAWTRHRFGARPDIGAISLTALGGMIASCGLVLLFR